MASEAFNPADVQMGTVEIEGATLEEDAGLCSTEEFVQQMRGFLATLDEWDEPPMLVIWSGKKLVGFQMMSDIPAPAYLPVVLPQLLGDFPPRAFAFSFEGWSRNVNKDGSLSEKTETRILAVASYEGYVETGHLVRGQSEFKTSRAIVPKTRIGDALLGAAEGAWGKGWKAEQRDLPTEESL